MNHIQLPASKSLGARFLVCSYFAGTLGHQPRMDDCDDLRVIQNCLLELELNREWLEMGQPPLDVHASGTAFRFLAAVTASTPGADFLLTGTPRLCGRPMTQLLRVLELAGAKITPKGENGTGPYRIQGRRIEGGEFDIAGDISSQFISALMLVAPTWRRGMKLNFITPLVSRPYVEMTAAVMERFGVKARLSETSVEVPSCDYFAPRDFKIEADWSAAGFFYTAALLSGKEININGLVPPGESLQGDAKTAIDYEDCDVFSKFHPWGVALTGDFKEGDKESGWSHFVRLSMTSTPDLVPAFTVGCCFSNIHFSFTGVRNLRVKESDRLAVMQTELRRFGFVLEVDDDEIRWKGERCEKEDNPEVRTYDDHRIAMAFAMAAFKTGRVVIRDPQVVDKSFTRFWQQLPKLGLKTECEVGSDKLVVKNC